MSAKIATKNEKANTQKRNKFSKVHHVQMWSIDQLLMFLHIRSWQLLRTKSVKLKLKP